MVRGGRACTLALGQEVFVPGGRWGSSRCWGRRQCSRTGLDVTCERGDGHVPRGRWRGGPSEGFPGEVAGERRVRPREAVPQPHPSPPLSRWGWTGRGPSCFPGRRVRQRACPSGEAAALNLPLKRNQLTRPEKVFYAFYLFYLELLGLAWVPGVRVRRASRGLSAAEASGKTGLPWAPPRTEVIRGSCPSWPGFVEAGAGRGHAP